MRRARGTLPTMLFMVIERFKAGNASLIGERFANRGRMLPDGVTYHASWVDAAGARCFQIMEASHPEFLNQRVRHWDDLVDFEIVPVLASTDHWSKLQSE
jgi:hypothetical protein